MPTLILTATLALGIASQYAPSVMPRVVAYRQRHGQLSQNISRYAGFVAVPECERIGESLWVRPVGGEWELMLVTDCANKSDSRWQDGMSGYEWMVRGGVLIEVDFETALRWDCVGHAKRIETARARLWRGRGPIP